MIVRYPHAESKIRRRNYSLSESTLERQRSEESIRRAITHARWSVRKLVKHCKRERENNWIPNPVSNWPEEWIRETLARKYLVKDLLLPYALEEAKRLIWK